MSTRGRLAPTPSGFLHIGHARTFSLAAARANGDLVLRVEDLDLSRCHTRFVEAALDDLRWLGLRWSEGPDCGGAYGPYSQRERDAIYRRVWRQLAEARIIYPSPHSRRDVETAAVAPHATDSGEIVFPVALRPNHWDLPDSAAGVPWRFRVPDGRVIRFIDERLGPIRLTAGVDFGDFVVWRRENLAAYELAVVADDHFMNIAEVVRGEDLLASTARQVLLYEALGWEVPRFYHAPLVRDPAGKRLAKRAGGLTICDLRRAGVSPDLAINGPLEEIVALASQSTEAQADAVFPDTQKDSN